MHAALTSRQLSTLPKRKRAIGVPLVGLMVMATVSGSARAQEAQDAKSGRAFAIVPSLSLTETFTDNAGLVSTNKESEFISQISAGLHMSSNAGRIRGSVDYSLTGYLYANGTQKNGLQNTLSALATAEAIENFAFVDVSAAISQQAISAFGKQTADPALNNSNRTEVATYSLSPYLRGRFLETGNYEARLTQSGTKSDKQGVGIGNSDSSTSQGRLHIGAGTPLGRLKWATDASAKSIDYQGGRRSEIDSLSLSLSYAISTELQLSLSGGREANNLTSVDKQSHWTSGASLKWQPTERTKFVVEGERRFFGNSHRLSFEHRTPRTVWVFSDSQDISSGGDQSSAGSIGSAYDLFFTQFASAYPDPVLRAQMVNDYLRARNISPTSQIIGGFQTSGVTLTRSQILSFALLGLRDTVTFTATRTSSRRIDSLTTTTDDLSNGDNIHQLVYSADASHRLTPDSSVNLVVSQQKSTGLSTARSTTLRSYVILWSGRVSSRTSVSVSARHAKFTSLTEPYTENALTASLQLKF
ncbi:hypothetical protein BH11PSE8_BH11PSE8_06100 [soil metagenome]